MRRARRVRTVAAGILGLAMVATACSGTVPGEGGSTPSTANDEPITLTLSTYGELGYADLVQTYQDEHPNITIEHETAVTSNEARDQFFTALAAGSGLADVVAVDVDWMPEIMQHSDAFLDLTADFVAGRWHRWTVDRATRDGKLLGYPVDIGPEALAYRADLFDAAGLPSERGDVEALFEENGGGWDQFFAVGRHFVAAGNGVPFYDSSGAIAQGMLSQIEAPFEDPGTGAVAISPQVKAIYTQVLREAALSAHYGQWSRAWTASFQHDGFAVMLCPSWMTGIIAGYADGVTGWDIADVFPGGGGNWGGTFLAVPSTTAHPEEAKALADWLTAPDQQVVAFGVTGDFPSQIKAQANARVAAMTSAFFNDAPTGAIFTNRAAALERVPFKGAHYLAVRDALSQAINRVDVERTDTPDASWATFQTTVAAL